MRQRTMVFGLIFLSFFLMGAPAAQGGTTIFAPIDGINGIGSVLGADQSPHPGADDNSESNIDDSQGGGGCGGGG